MLLPLVRGLFAASLLSSFGAALLLRGVLPRASPRIEVNLAEAIERRCRLVAGSSIALALLAGLAWLLLEARAMAETNGLAETLAALPAVLLGTWFGKVLLLQGIALGGAGAALALFPQRSALPAGLAATATLLEAGHSHAFAMSHGPNLLLLSQALHLLAGGAWLGGLLPLLIMVRQAPLDAAQDAAGRFSTLGASCVALLIATALYQGVLLSGGLAGLTGTAYGAMLLTKAALFAFLIGIAAINRLRLAPALAGPTGEGGRRALCLSIALETAIGLAVVLAASVLAGLEPSMHITGT